MKSLVSVCVGVLFSFFVFLPGAAAQDTPAKIINGGIINGKAVSLPHPVYPEAARAAGIGGIAGVNVIIDEAGLVVFAEAELNDQRERRNEDGTKAEPVLLDPSLREAAEAAAREAHFSPTTLGGQPVRIKGKILYNFVVDKSDRPARVGDINGPLVNGKAISMPAPIYPAPAKAVNVQGTVTVKVMINEDGSVSSAAAINGHPLLRAAAEAAAREARFAPTLVGGKPMSVAGIVTYDFVLPAKDQ